MLKTLVVPAALAVGLLSVASAADNTAPTPSPSEVSTAQVYALPKAAVLDSVGPKLQEARAKIEAAIEKLKAGGEIPGVDKDALIAGLQAAADSLTADQIAPLQSLNLNPETVEKLGQLKSASLDPKALEELGQVYKLAPQSTPQFFQSAPQGDTHQLVIKLNDKGEYEVSGDGVPQERLDKIREKLKDGRVDLREGVTIQRDADGQTITINGTPYALAAPQAFTLQPGQGLDPDQLKKIIEQSVQQGQSGAASSGNFPAPVYVFPKVGASVNGAPNVGGFPIDLFQKVAGAGLTDDQLKELHQQIRDVVEKYLEEHKAADK